MSVSDGRQFVCYAADICEQLGYSVWVPTKETCGPWDMIVNNHKVQVKKRGVCTSKPNNVRLKTALGPAVDVYATKDVDAFCIHWKDRWYVVPSHAVARVDGVIRNGIYMPSLAEWVDRWDVLDGRRYAMSMQRQFDF